MEDPAILLPLIQRLPDEYLVTKLVKLSKTIRRHIKKSKRWKEIFSKERCLNTLKLEGEDKVCKRYTVKKGYSVITPPKRISFTWNEIKQVE